MFSKEEIETLKKDFAKWWIKFPNEPYKAACIIFPDPKDMGNRLTVAHDWITDPFVLVYKDELLSDDSVSDKLLPKKGHLIADLYEISKSTTDPSAKIKALTAIADIKGMMPKSNISINNNNQQVGVEQSVMLVPNYGSDDEWQEHLYLQQQKLIATEIEEPSIDDNSTT